MLQYEKTHASEEIDINKTSASKECMFCHFWYFKDIGYKFELHICDKYHNVLMTAYELRNMAIWNVKDVHYGRILWCVSKNETVIILNNFVIEDKGAL